MSNEPVKAPPRSGAVKQFFKHLWKAISYRWVWKVTSLVIALALWASLLTQNASLVREKVFANVAVNVVNAAALQRSGLIVVDGLNDIEGVRIRVDVPQRNYSAVTAANYNVRVDLSQITHAGEQQVPLTATSTTTYGTVTDISLKQITVTVEEYVTRSRIPVRVETEGVAPENFYATGVSVDPAMITISGPQSTVSAVARCVAQYDMSLLKPIAGTERTAAPFVLLDVFGQVVDSSQITVTNESVVMDSIVVEQTLYPCLTVALNRLGLVRGQPAEGYHIERVTVSPGDIRIAGNDLSSALGETLYLAGAVDITGAKETVTQSLTITRPSGVVYMSTDVAHVTVEIVADDAGEVAP